MTSTALKARDCHHPWSLISASQEPPRIIFGPLHDAPQAHSKSGVVGRPWLAACHPPSHSQSPPQRDRRESRSKKTLAPRMGGDTTSARAIFGSTRGLHDPKSSGQGEQMPKFHPSQKRREAPVDRRANASGTARQAEQPRAITDRLV